MISAISIVPWAHLHSCDLQWFLLPFQKVGRGSSLTLVPIPREVIRSLNWWRSPAIAKGCQFHEPQRLVVTTDASLSAWGAHFQSTVAQGRWSASERQWNINYLELWAVFIALRAFWPFFVSSHVLVLTDNVATKAHVNRQGGTRSRTLLLEAKKLGLWTEHHLVSLQVEHILGVSNVRVDWLSQQQIDHAERHLNPTLFKDITLQFGIPEVNLFATHINAQLPHFVSLFPTPQAEAVDALRIKWPPGPLYVFLPILLILKVIRKILLERAEVILLAPHWPQRSWFPDLMTL